MFEVLGEEYYIDVEALIEKCKPVVNTFAAREEGDEVDDRLDFDAFKFDCYKVCLDRVISEYENKDDDVATFTSKTTNPGFGIAFNTLLKNEILKT